MRISRLHLTAAIAATAALALTGCANTTDAGESSEKTVRLSGVAFNATDPYWITLMCGATEAANDAGSNIEWFAGNTSAVAEQQTNFDAALLKSPDAVVIGAVQPEPFSAQVEQTMTEGIPVVAVNSPVAPDTAYQTIQSSTDNAEFIDYVVGDIGTSGSIGILAGVPGDIPVLLSRWEPLVEQLGKTAPDLKVLDVQYDDFDRNKATRVAAALITGNPDLKAIYAISGPEGEGAAAAVEEAGKSGEIKVYAYDATPGEVDALRNGSISALLAQPAKNMGYRAAEAAIEAVAASERESTLSAQAIPSEDLPLRVLTADNIDDEASAGYIYSTSCQ